MELCRYPCPNKTRYYEIEAIQIPIVYNKYGDHDPDGLLFVPLEDADQALCTSYRPKPLILRANAGEWIEITLHNFFNPGKPIQYFDYPRVPLDVPHTPSMRVSLNPQFLNYDPVCDSGINKRLWGQLKSCAHWPQKSPVRIEFSVRQDSLYQESVFFFPRRISSIYSAISSDIWSKR